MSGIIEVDIMEFRCNIGVKSSKHSNLQAASCLRAFMLDE